MSNTAQTAENRRLWVEALRSGEYTQFAGYLNRNNKYCCLGVACEVAMKNGVDLKRTRCEDTGVVDYGNETELPPGRVVEWLGLATQDGALTGPVQVNGRDFHVLTALNDEADYTFEQIADLIEQGMVKLDPSIQDTELQHGSDNPPSEPVDRVAEEG